MLSSIQKSSVVFALTLSILAAGCNGQGDPVFRVTPEPAGENCQYGGLKVEYGFDDNDNKKLDDAEVDPTQTQYACGVLVEGKTSRITITPEPAGDNCANGGYKISSGLDLNDNRQLDANEIESTVYVCNGIDAINGQVRSVPEPIGPNCANGGHKIQVGLDTNRNGVFEDSEVTSNSYVCNGRDAINGMVKVVSEPMGANCGNGGYKVTTGLDTNKNGQLDAAEVTATSYVCNGLNSLTRLSQLPSTHNPGPNQCEFGGTKIDSGLDLNGDKTLQDTEVQTTSVVCSVQVLANVIVESKVINPGDPTSTCTQGGIRMTAGVDTNDDHVLQPGEVTGTSDICNQVQVISGKNGLIKTFNATSGQCAWGGYVIQSGLDANYNNLLDSTEVQSTSVVCNGANGFNSLVKQTPDNGTGCGTRGGIKYESGLDTDRDNILDAGEVTQSGYVCNGYEGPQGPEGYASLIKQSADTTVCGPRGGVRIDTGVDLNWDGILQLTEIDYTSWVCNGYDGYDGYNSLIKPTAIAPGSTCTYGGVRYDTGLDLNEDGTLQSTEVDYSSYVCHGESGSLVEIWGVDPGSICTNGGIEIDIGKDTNFNGVLDSSEIDQIQYLCNP